MVTKDDFQSLEHGNWIDSSDHTSDEREAVARTMGYCGLVNLSVLSICAGCWSKKRRLSRFLFSFSLSLAIHSITHMSGRKVQVENDGTYAIPKKNLRNSRVGIWKERMIMDDGWGMMDDGWWHLRNSRVGIWKERRTRRISGWMTSGTEWTLCRRSERKQLSIVFIKGQKVMRMKGAGYFWSKHDTYFFPSIFDFKTTKTVGPIVREHWSGVQHLWFILLHIDLAIHQSRISLNIFALIFALISLRTIGLRLRHGLLFFVACHWPTTCWSQI